MNHLEEDRETSCPACCTSARPLRGLYTTCGAVFLAVGGIVLIIGIITGIQLVQGDFNYLLATVFFLLSGGTVVYAGYGFLRSRDKTCRCTACGRLLSLAVGRTRGRRKWWR